MLLLPGNSMGQWILEAASFLALGQRLFSSPMVLLVRISGAKCMEVALHPTTWELRSRLTGPVILFSPGMAIRRSTSVSGRNKMRYTEVVTLLRPIRSPATCHPRIGGLNTRQPSVVAVEEPGLRLTHSAT